MKLCWVFASISLVLTTTNHVGSVMASELIDDGNNGFLTVGDTPEPSAVPSTSPSPSSVPSIIQSTSPSSVPTSAPTSLISDTGGLIHAIRSASSDPRHPSAIYVDVNAAIDFDDGTTDVEDVGESLNGKYFDAICVGYDEMNKCTMERSKRGGRFFISDRDTDPFDVKFEGFKFTGGKNTHLDNEYGGAFSFQCEGRRQCAFSATFVGCSFEGNYADDDGGAISLHAYVTRGQTPKATHLSIYNCTFHNNRADDNGGAIAATARGSLARVRLDIHGTNFTDNSLYEKDTKGKDIFGKKRGGGTLIFSCTNTTTNRIGNNAIVVPKHQGVEQNCSNSE